MSTDNGNKSAFPEGDYNAGLTNREWLAGMALNGILASPAVFTNAEHLVKYAPNNADALLTALEKQDQP